MITLEQLIQATAVKTVTGSASIEVTGLAYDSRKVEAGNVFYALPGVFADGGEYVDAAIKAGATAIVSQATAPEDCSVTWVQVHDARESMGLMADAFYGHPSGDFPVVGITGTNGKTTTAFLLHHLIKCSRHRCGLLGTVTYDTCAETYDAPHTTPESPNLQRLFAEMRDHGAKGAVIEVSSHGLAQHRTAGIDFAAGIFTNLSQDHLDYHKTMDRYFEAKILLFEQMNALGRSGKKAPAAIINLDDTYGGRLAKLDLPDVRKVTFGMGVHCDFRANNIRADFDGTQFQLEMPGRKLLVRIPLIGRFNVYNTLAALAAAHSIGLNMREAIANIATAPQTPGRLEAVTGLQTNYRVFVDYAHTPDGLENALQAVKELNPERIITVFGCGGDRDETKRPLMAAAVQRTTDIAVITSDNPRTEDPFSILADIEEGMGKHKNYTVIEDRKEAIRTAIEGAKAKDIVLIAGKGHETYQEIDGVRHPFNDLTIARHFMEQRASRIPEPTEEDDEDNSYQRR